MIRPRHSASEELGEETAMQVRHDYEENPYWTDDIGLFEGVFRYTHEEPRGAGTSACE